MRVQTLLDLTVSLQGLGCNGHEGSSSEDKRRSEEACCITAVGGNPVLSVGRCPQVCLGASDLSSASNIGGTASCNGGVSVVATGGTSVGLDGPTTTSPTTGRDTVAKGIDAGGVEWCCSHSSASVSGSHSGALGIVNNGSDLWGRSAFVISEEINVHLGGLSTGQCKARGQSNKEENTHGEGGRRKGGRR